MKKMLFGAAMLCVALTGCENEEMSVANQAQALRFDAPAMMQTRANVFGEISGKQYPVDENFQVYCKAYKGNFAGWTKSSGVIDYFASAGEEAKNGHTVGSNKYWSTDIVHYWPEVEYNLAFAAYSPATFTTSAASISHTEKGLQIVDFTTEGDCNKQYDLMFSNRKYDMNKAKNSNGAVPLMFNHALSSIVFSSQKGSTDVDYIITKVEVNGNFCQQADFNQNITETVADGVYSETAAPQWENPAPETPATYVPTFTEFSVPAEAPAQFTSGTSAMLLIPQDVPEDATVTLYYTKITNPGVDGVEKQLNTSATIKLSDFQYTEEGGTELKKITKWEMGNRYIYRIAFGQNTRIYFEPEVTDWVKHPTLVYTIQ